MLHIFWFFWY